ncbi:MAG: fructose-specific PTS transporter subunit EIIC [Actinobacteria bacterium]|nr:fructose-specific PTS transporter subunit EIIC [Actinomycetota bacterium]
MTSLITADLVRLDSDLGQDKASVIRSLAHVVVEAGRTQDVEQLVADVLARETTAATGLKGGIAIPHCRTTAVSEPTLVFARLAPAVDFGAKDGPADLAFLIAAPEGGDATHLQLLTKLARALVRPDFTEALRSATTAAQVVALVSDVLEPPAEPAGEPAGEPAVPAASSAPTTAARSLVAVTACPTGIAHTYMAAEALEAAAARAGVTIAVETQGSAGSTPLAAATIESADAVIFACDVGVRDQHRFAGLPVVSTGVKSAVDDADALVARALQYADSADAPRVEAGAEGSVASGAPSSVGGTVRRVLMTGVSYMIPFVAAGGLLIALSFLLGGYQIVNHGDIATGNSLLALPDLDERGLDNALFGSAALAYLGALLFVLGGAAFGFLVPALAGYIAYAIADRPGIAPGFVMGAIAGTTQSGFLGGIVGGVLAGLSAKWISGWKVPTWARGLMPVLVIPLLATIISGLVMLVLLGRPLGSLMVSLSDGLDYLGERPGLAILLGALLGAMMAFDMGGPLNKTAYAFATTGLTAAATATDAPELRVMAAVMLGGMVPPIALALATVLRPRLFNVAERENGKAGWLLGASFITEGAIPFAAADPLRVIPSIMLGSAVTGGLSQAFDVSLRAPHGGIFVLFAVDGVVGFMVALAAGVLVATAAVLALKSHAARGAVGDDASTPVAA